MAVPGTHIDLSTLEKPRIDLKGVRGTVTLSGEWRGDRLVIYNAESVALENRGDVRIFTDREEAIALVNPLEVVVRNSNSGEFRLNGALQVWEGCHGLTVSGLSIVGAHTGIRINQKYPYRNIRISRCLIADCSHEGIYIGPHEQNDTPLQNVTVEHCEVVGCAWDGIQIGNTLDFRVEGNVVRSCGLKKQAWQDFAITINPGSRGHLIGNQVTGKIQVLDSRAFFA